MSEVIITTKTVIVIVIAIVNHAGFNFHFALGVGFAY